MQAVWQQGQHAVGGVNRWSATSARLAVAQKLQRDESGLLRLSQHGSEVTDQRQRPVKQGSFWVLSQPQSVPVTSLQLGMRKVAEHLCVWAYMVPPDTWPELSTKQDLRNQIMHYVFQHTMRYTVLGNSIDSAPDVLCRPPTPKECFT